MTKMERWERLAWLSILLVSMTVSAGAVQYVVGSSVDVRPGVLTGTLMANATIPTSKLSQAATSGQDGYLTSANWSAFNAKLGSPGASKLVSTDAGSLAAAATITSPLLWSGSALSLQQASGSQAGYLSSLDWGTFNGKLGSPGNSLIVATNGSGAATSVTVGSGLSFTSGTLSATATSPFDTGDIKATARSTAPTGWLMCDGSAVSRTTFSNLFSVISTTYGSGDGSTTFNVPDARGRVLLGADPTGANNGGTTFALGDQGGTYFPSYSGTTASGGGGTVTSSGPSSSLGITVLTGTPGAGQTGVPISVADSSHTHSVTFAGHTHTFSGTLALNPPHTTINYVIKE